MSDLTYRARTATEIVDGTFRLYREHFVAFVTLSALMYLPVIAFAIPLFGMTDRLSGNTSVLAAVFIAFALFSIFWYPILWGSLMVSASERYLGRDIETGDAVRRAFSRFGPLVGSSFVKWLLVGLGAFFLLFPSFYFIARYFAVPAAALLEGRGVGATLKRSSQLSVNQKGRILGTLALSWLILIGVYITIWMAFGIIALVALKGNDTSTMSTTSSLLLQLPGMIANILGIPIVVIAETLLYYDVRIRQEGYDIELMTAQLPAVGAGAAAH